METKVTLTNVVIFYILLTGYSQYTTGHVRDYSLDITRIECRCLRTTMNAAMLLVSNRN